MSERGAPRAQAGTATPLARRSRGAPCRSALPPGPLQAQLQQEGGASQGGAAITQGGAAPPGSAVVTRQQQRLQQAAGNDVPAAETGQAAASRAARDPRLPTQLPARAPAAAEAPEAPADGGAEEECVRVQHWRKQLSLDRRAKSILEMGVNGKVGAGGSSGAASERAPAQQQERQARSGGRSASAKSGSSTVRAKPGAPAAGTAERGRHEQRQGPPARCVEDGDSAKRGAERRCSNAAEERQPHSATDGRVDGARCGAKRKRKMEAHPRRAQGVAQPELAAAGELSKEDARQQLKWALRHLRQAAATNTPADQSSLALLPLW